MDDSRTKSNFPSELSVVQYAEARAEEVLSMAKILKLQPKLPRHMRRRAASHNVKRLPRTQRDWTEREMAKSGTPIKPKCPSRKHRRRPCHLLQEYNRRQRQHTWLETHIWHAKRFHMTEQWGYKIPFHPNDKGARAAYKATAKYCLMEDVSYHCCIELHGHQQHIVDHISKLCSQNTGLTFGAKAYINGNKEGHITLYRKEQYPHGTLGDVRFMWRYTDNITTEADRQLWIWTHPAIYEEVLEELRTLFHLTKDNEKADEKQPQSLQSNQELVSLPKSGKERRTLLDKKSLDKLSKQNTSSKKKLVSTDPNPLPHIPVVQNPCYSDGTVTVRSLKDTLCRFHLTGPLSNDVLLDALHASSFEDIEESSDEDSHKWWKKLSHTEWQTLHKHQTDFWNDIRTTTSSPAELTPNCILGLIVRDPRLSLPIKKSMVSYNQKSDFSHTKPGEVHSGLSWSPLWQSNVREQVKASMMSVQEINFKRSECLIPGSDLNLENAENKVPVLLIQNPGRQMFSADFRMASQGFGSGWDLIVPGGWGMGFLMNLVFRGARVTGLRDSQHLAVEHGILPFPCNSPDSSAGCDWELQTQTQRLEKHQRMPPAKRSSFNKLGQMKPYSYPWAQLVKEWDAQCQQQTEDKSMSATSKKFYVLRDRQLLRKLQANVGKASNKLQKITVASDITQAKEACVRSLPSCLVAVQLSMVLRGKPQAFSSICLPLPEDLSSLSNDRTYSGQMEPIHKLPITSNTEEMEDVVLVTSSTRHIVGYVKEGNFSFATGHGYGLGFVAGSSFSELWTHSEDMNGKMYVLVRALGSRQYRFAELSVLS